MLCFAYLPTGQRDDLTNWSNNKRLFRMGWTVVILEDMMLFTALVAGFNARTHSVRVGLCLHKVGALRCLIKHKTAASLDKHIQV